MPSDSFLDKILRKKFRKSEKLVRIPLANIRDEAFGAVWGAGGADVAAVEENPVVGVWEELGRDAGEEALFDGFGGGAFGQADFWGDAQEMGVYGHCGLMENNVQYYVCGFAAYAGEGHELFTGRWDFAAKIRNELLGKAHYVFCFISI